MCGIIRIFGLDGTKTTVWPDGSKVVVRPDGTREGIYPLGDDYEFPECRCDYSRPFWVGTPVE